MYTVSHNAYFPLTDSAILAGDTTIRVEITRRLADLHFEISDAAGPLAGAGVSLFSWEISTGSDGTAWFTNQPAREYYEYTITSNGYRTIFDSLFLELDTTVSILMDPITGIQDRSGELYEIFPNPAEEELYIRSVSSGAIARLYSPDGKILKEHRILSGMNTIRVQEIPPGLYYILIHSASNTIHRKLVLQ